MPEGFLQSIWVYDHPTKATDCDHPSAIARRIKDGMY